MIRIQFMVALAWISFLPTFAVGQVFQWEFIDPAHPALGKRESTTLAPDGASAHFDNISGLYNRDLTKAYLFQANIRRFNVRTTILDDAYLVGADMYGLSGSNGLIARRADMSQANLQFANLNRADLSMSSLVNADLTGADLTSSTLAGVDFTGAEITDARFVATTAKGFTAQQLYQTASYQQGELGTIQWSSNDLRGWDFTGQRMVRSKFAATQLDGANFTDAIVNAVDFSQSNLAATQLYATGSYKNRQLDEIELSAMDLSGWNLSRQSLRRARFTLAELSGAVFDNADLTNAVFRVPIFEVQSDVSFRGANLTKAAFDSNGRWERADFTGANLEGTQLSNNGFVDSKFDDAIIRGAELINVFTFGFTLDNLYSTASYKSGDLTDIRVQFGDLTGANFRGLDISETKFIQVTLDSADFRNAKAVDAFFGGSFEGADFRGADLTGAGFSYDSVTFIDFRGANLTNADFSQARAAGADLTDAIIFGTNFIRASGVGGLSDQQLYSTASYQAGQLGPVGLEGDMRGWDFRGQDLTGARFDRNSQLDGAQWAGATLSETLFLINSLQNSDFSQADVRNTRFIASNLQGADFRNSDLSGATFGNNSLVDGRLDGAILNGTDIAQMDLTNASFAGADLRNARFRSNTYSNTDFSGADIRYTSFGNAFGNGFTVANLMSTQSYQDRDLTGIGLAYSPLVGVDFSEINLSESRFNNSDLTDTSFVAANLTNANFRSAILNRTGFSNATVVGIDLGGATRNGFVREQLYSTASYQQRDLRRVDLSNNDLSGWDFSNINLSNADLESSDVTGAVLTGATIRGAQFNNWSGGGIVIGQLISTASYQQKDLSGVGLGGADLTGLDLSEQQLQGANLDTATLSSVNFSGAWIQGARLRNTTSGGFTAQQLYSTANFQQRDLRGIDFDSNYLNGWNFSNQNLIGASFDRLARNSRGVFFQADLRGAVSPSSFLRNSQTTNMIYPDGTIYGLSLFSNGNMVIRNYEPFFREGDETIAEDPIAIVVNTVFRMQNNSTLKMELSNQDWNSTISFVEGTPVTLGGTLELFFAAEVDPQAQVGRVFELFDWTGVTPTGAFTVAADPQLVWDISQLYSTGTVQLLSVVPEPTSLLLLVMAISVVLTKRLGGARINRP